MELKEFLNVLDKNSGVNGPACRGASQPPMNPFKINESEFEDELRFKEVDSFIDGNKYVINWTSQTWTENTETFFNEITRWAKAVAKRENFAEDFIIHIYLMDRDCENHLEKDIEISFE